MVDLRVSGLTLLSILLGAGCALDVIQLKSGTSYEGEILSNPGDDPIVIELDYGQVFVARSRVKAVERRSETGDSSRIVWPAPPPRAIAKAKRQGFEPAPASLLKGGRMLLEPFACSLATPAVGWAWFQRVLPDGSKQYACLGPEGQHYRVSGYPKPLDLSEVAVKKMLQALALALWAEGAEISEFRKSPPLGSFRCTFAVTRPGKRRFYMEAFVSLSKDRLMLIMAARRSSFGEQVDFGTFVGSFEAH